MQLDLALFIRLSRTLEGTQTDGHLALDDHSAVLGALDRFLLSVSERADMLRAREAVQAPVEVEVEVEETRDVSVVVEEEAPPQVWTRQHDMLYEDVLWLFRIGDNEGALISLGRLLHVAGDTQELKRFLDINQSKLSALYERILGPFGQPLTVTGNGIGDRYFHDAEAVLALLKLGRDTPTVEELLDRSPLPRMKTLALLHRLQMESLVAVQPAGVQPTAH